jgi:Ca2+:H+ antiporter
VQEAALTFGMTSAFVGFIIVALVGGAAEMASAFSAARKNRLDLSVALPWAVPPRSPSLLRRYWSC